MVGTTNRGGPDARTRRCGWAGALLLSLVSACGLPPPAPTITYFGTDVGVITSGTDLEGTAVQGAVILEWQTRGAQSVRLLDGDLPLPTAGCETVVAGSDCVRDGRLLVRPTATTELRLRATRGAGDCGRDEGILRWPEECAEASRPVAVVPPALAWLSTDTPEVEAGGDVVVRYRVERSVGWVLGVVDPNAANGLVACAAAPGTGASCWLARDTAGLIPDEGEAVFEGLTADLRVGILAVNGAADTLGRITPEQVFLDLRVRGP